MYLDNLAVTTESIDRIALFSELSVWNYYGYKARASETFLQRNSFQGKIFILKILLNSVSWKHTGIKDHLLMINCTLLIDPYQISISFQ